MYVKHNMMCISPVENCVDAVDNYREKQRNPCIIAAFADVGSATLSPPSALGAGWPQRRVYYFKIQESGVLNV